MMSKQDLQREAKINGFRPEMLEKVYRLLDLLGQFMGIPFLKDRLALKGGSAINLFCTDTLPRLSVDLDFNYIGSANREIMRQEKEKLEAILIDTCRRFQYDLDRNAHAHAGGKMIFVYQSVLGNKGRIEIDLNYLFRIPLWSIDWRCSPAWPKATYTNILDIHEIAAGKLHALLGRQASRDLFDSHQLLTKWPLNPEKLRLAFVVYAGMERDHWQRISVTNIQFTAKDIRDKLIPVLKISEAPFNSVSEVEMWAKRLVAECQDALAKLLPFQDNEIEFLERLQQEGEIAAELISNDNDFCKRVAQHPSLLWRAQKAARSTE